MQLEAIHARAIDLLVSGERQMDIAKELNIGVRTLRRWATDGSFMTEFTNQRDCAQQLQTAQRAAAARIQRQVMEVGARKICELINDPNTPDMVRVQCLRISQQVLARAEAQEWREFVYFDTIAREEAKEAAERKRIEDDQKASKELFESLQRQSRTPSAARTPSAPATPAATPALSIVPPPPEKRRIAADPIAAADKLIAEVAALKQVHENRPKAAKTGHPIGESAAIAK